MNLLLISYYYGDTASGIITQRVAEAFRLRGNTVFIVTGNSSIEDDGLYKCPNLFSDSGFVSRAIRKLYWMLTKDTLEYQFVWRRRAFRKSCKIIETNSVDWIYCRTSPIDAFQVGDKLKRKYGVKELLHFTDPVPSEFSTFNQYILNRLINKYKDIIERADLLSFGTIEMQRHEQKLFDMNLSKKAFVSPDAAKSPVFVSLPPKEGIEDSIILVYLGSIAGYRNPLPLFHAVDSLRTEGYNVKLLVYSVRPVSIKYDSEGIYYCGRTPHVEQALQQADILIDLDVKMKNSPFISSKIKDYIRVNRPIVAITQKNSPTYNATDGLSTIVLVENEESVIRTAIIKALSFGNNPEQYHERQELLNYFSPQVVVSTIINRMKQLEDKDL